MAVKSNATPPLSIAALGRLMYLLGVVILVFWFPDSRVLLILLAVQLALSVLSRLPFRLILKASRRLLILLLILLISYGFFPSGRAEEQYFEVLGVFVSPDGALLAVLMWLRVITMVVASIWVLYTTEQADLVRALQFLLRSEFLSQSIVATLSLLGGNKSSGDGSGGGRGGGKNRKNKTPVTFAQLRRGDFSFLSHLITRGLDKTEHYVQEAWPAMEQTRARDLGIIAGISVAMMGLKMIQMLPGLPIAPGHKNLVMIPMFLLASRLTSTRFGGFYTGTTVGFASFLLGYGKYGIAELLQFMVPGLLADLLLPLAGARRRWVNAGLYTIIGAILGFARFSANLAVIFLVGAPLPALVLYFPMLISQVMFGAMSSLVCMYLLSPETVNTLGKNGVEDVKTGPG